jgi:23S rRNA pseudouridine2605 synthase
MTSPPKSMDDSASLPRLHKVLAQAGVASRRAAEEMIARGRVQVNGAVVREMGVRVDPDNAVIHVDGMRLELRSDIEYLALNKPRGVHSTMADDRGRPCVGDYVADRARRLFHVGRLDADTEGLLLLTNDGELAHRLMHPSYRVLKTYLAEVPGPVPRSLGRTLRAGIQFDDGPVAVDGFRVVQALPGKALVEVVLHEGRKHIVRRLLAEVGHPVHRLVRTAIADVRLGEQRPGSVRALSHPEIAALNRAVGR